MRQLLLIFFLSLTACTARPLVKEPLQVFSIYATPALEGWLPLVYNCAAETPGMLLSRILDITSADISLRLAAPMNSDAFVYQIGEVEFVVGNNLTNPVRELSESQLTDIFEGKIRNWSQVGGNDAEIVLWAYGLEDDLQKAFNETLLDGRTLSSFARQATSETMIQQAISIDVRTLGFLSNPQGSKNIQILHSVGKYPVLMIINMNSQNLLRSLMLCIQGD